MISKAGSRNSRYRERQRGFTLIELLCVVVIIGMLFALITVAVTKVVGNARNRKAKVDVKTIASGIVNFRHEYDLWPGGYTKGVHTNDGSTGHGAIIDDLDVDSTVNFRKVPFVNWDEYSLKDDTIVDPWGKPYGIIINCDKDKVTVTNSYVNTGATY